MIIEKNKPWTQVAGIFLIVSLSFSAKAGIAKVDGQTAGVSSAEFQPIRLSKEGIERLEHTAEVLASRVKGFQPLSTSEMTICRDVQPKRIEQKQLASPLFVVGDDPLSMQWLRGNKDTLLKLHAVGLIVSASSLKVFGEVKNIIGDLRIYPAEGNAVARFFGITCYPVLISKHLIEQ